MGGSSSLDSTHRGGRRRGPGSIERDRADASPQEIRKHRETDGDTLQRKGVRPRFLSVEWRLTCSIAWAAMEL
jgi:hypothetical protein